MSAWNLRRIRRLNIVTHRDVGYILSSMILIYCISGLALNHIDDWNPDFILKKDTVSLGRSYVKDEVDNKALHAFAQKVGQEKWKVHDFPTSDQLKVYFDDASLHVYLLKGYGVYEHVSRRPIFYESNVLHRNSVKGWKWVSDIFAVLLIVVNVSGLFILRGKTGISGRGKWLILGGLIPPLVAIVVHSVL